MFLDRDGVINKVVMRDGFPGSPRALEEVQLVDDAQSALQIMRKMGFLIIIVTNQPELSRGLLNINDLDKIHHFIRQNLPVDDIFVCPHDKRDECVCRKPKSGMLLAAAQKWKIDLRKSFMIGDRLKDVEAGERAGCCPILIDAPYNKDTHCRYRVDHLTDAVRLL